MFGPLGPQRGDYHAALVAYTTAAAQGGKNLKLSDFLLRWGGRRRQAGVEILNTFRALAARMSK